jgi:hypothetical protein
MSPEYGINEFRSQKLALTSAFTVEELAQKPPEAG